MNTFMSTRFFNKERYRFIVAGAIFAITGLTISPSPANAISQTAMPASLKLAYIQQMQWAAKRHVLTRRMTNRPTPEFTMAIRPASVQRQTVRHQNQTGKRLLVKWNAKRQVLAQKMGMAKRTANLHHKALPSSRTFAHQHSIAQQNRKRWNAHRRELARRMVPVARRSTAHQRWAAHNQQMRRAAYRQQQVRRMAIVQHRVAMAQRAAAYQRRIAHNQMRANAYRQQQVRRMAIVQRRMAMAQRAAAYQRRIAHNQMRANAYRQQQARRMPTAQRKTGRVNLSAAHLRWLAHHQQLRRVAYRKRLARKTAHQQRQPRRIAMTPRLVAKSTRSGAHQHQFASGHKPDYQRSARSQGRPHAALLASRSTRGLNIDLGSATPSPRS